MDTHTYSSHCWVKASSFFHHYKPNILIHSKYLCRPPIGDFIPQLLKNNVTQRCNRKTYVSISLLKKMRQTFAHREKQAMIMTMCIVFGYYMKQQFPCNLTPCHIPQIYRPVLTQRPQMRLNSYANGKGMMILFLLLVTSHEVCGSSESLLFTKFVL